MRLSAALLVGVLLAVSAVSGVGASHPVDDATQSSTTVADSSSTPSERALALTDPSTARSDLRSTVNSSANATVRDGTEMYVTVHENGNARWNVTARFVLADENETAAFRQLARDYESGIADVGFSRETFARALEHAATDTDRSMELGNVDRTATVRESENESVGVLSLSFTWTNFGQVDGNRIYLGDVFWVESETWLPALTADQSFTVEGPDGYYVDSSNAPIDNGTRIQFEGPQTFQPGDFAMTYAPKRTVTTATTTTTSDGFPNLSGTSGLLVVLAVFGLGFGVYAASQRRGPDTDVTASTEDDDGPSGGAPPRDGGDGGDDGDGGATDRDDESDEDGPPPELLSDEERVLRLLRENGGRMKQADIVTETNWSNAKVSQLLSQMNDDGEVNKLRIGRENLITLPDEDVADLD